LKKEGRQADAPKKTPPLETLHVFRRRNEGGELRGPLRSSARKGVPLQRTVHVSGGEGGTVPSLAAGGRGEKDTFLFPFGEKVVPQYPSTKEKSFRRRGGRTSPPSSSQEEGEPSWFS